MKSKKGFFILLAVFLVLVVCYLALKVWTEKAQEEEQAKTEAEQIYLTDTDVSEITSFGYSNGETELSFVKEEDTWYSETDREVNLNQSSVENMLSQNCLYIRRQEAGRSGLALLTMVWKIRSTPCGILRRAERR